MTQDLRAVAELSTGLGNARASDRRLGQQIAATAEIDFTTQETVVTARVGATPASGGRTVRSTRGRDRVHWSCTCTGDESPWCKHAIAAILAADA